MVEPPPSSDEASLAPGGVVASGPGGRSTLPAMRPATAIVIAVLLLVLMAAGAFQVYAILNPAT